MHFGLQSRYFQFVRLLYFSANIHTVHFSSGLHYCLIRIYFENNNYLLICIKILKVNLNSVYHVHKRYWKQSSLFGIVCQVPLHPIFILSFRVYNDNNIVFFESKFIFVICLTIVKCATFSSFSLEIKSLDH